MAKTIKRTNIAGEKADIIRNNIEKYKSIWRQLSQHMNDSKEQVYLLTFTDGEVCDGKYNISADGGTESSVGLNKEEVESLFSAMKGAGITKWGISHNHPYVEDAAGKWVQTLVSDGDIITTEIMKQVAMDIDMDLEYVGHFVVNKEDNAEKIICIEDEMKFNYEIVEKIERGEV